MNAHPNAGVPRHDIQALLRSGFGSLRHARYLLLAVQDPARARQWLRELLASGWVRPASAVGGDAQHQSGVACVAFSAAGLAALGHRATEDAPFPTAFQQGMGAPERRALLREPPDAWHWHDQAGPADPPSGIAPPPATVHALLIVLSADPQGPAGLAPPDASGWQVVQALRGCPAYLSPAPGDAPSGTDPVAAAEAPRRPPMKAYEPFGFRDGVSQPIMPALRDPDARAVPRTDQNTPQADHQLALGEFVLGHRNEFGEAAYAPDLAGWQDHARRLGLGAQPFAHNGSYLAVRQIEQDAEAFISDHHAGCPMSPSHAERMIGRRRDDAGSPLQTWPWPPDTVNAFRYRIADREGFQCPRGAHIRRANPRDDLGHSIPLGVQVSRLHRLLRRGRPYSVHTDCPHPDCGDARHRQLAADGAPPGQTACGAGLMFIACNADLERQYEFVQQRWIAYPRFGELEDEVDPICGGRDTGLFTLPGLPGGQTVQLQRRYTRTQGGGYFLLPGLAALAFIASA